MVILWVCGDAFFLEGAGDGGRIRERNDRFYVCFVQKAVSLQRNSLWRKEKI